MDILDAQNVYTIDGYRKPIKTSPPTMFVCRLCVHPDPNTRESEIINIVTEFTKTSCSDEYDKKKCMGTSKTDQFNGKFAGRNHGK